jgi:hypothetical protein
MTREAQEQSRLTGLKALLSEHFWYNSRGKCTVLPSDLSFELVKYIGCPDDSDSVTLDLTITRGQQMIFVKKNYDVAKFNSTFCDKHKHHEIEGVNFYDLLNATSREGSQPDKITSLHTEEQESFVDKVESKKQVRFK